MNNPWLVLVLTLVGAGVVFGLAIVWRLRALSLRVGSFECALLLPQSRRTKWRAGIVHYRLEYLSWYPVLSLGIRPKYRWSRTEFVVLDHRARLADDQHTGIIESRCQTLELGEIIIAAPRDDYHGLVSWAESAPPGYRG